ncbi:hypothetical protein GCM10017771_10720 [Streptomyces capitiformicae]|uniref:Uncharacterized protein n=1 Tax=Streptomyces capitiformicae TaxID=2014920 RepID=A0A919GG05_9ACTN|nr:hypothetical protein GCM10017771_10720 [Streptomyces capitiformicae]
MVEVNSADLWGRPGRSVTRAIDRRVPGALVPIAVSRASLLVAGGVLCSGRVTLMIKRLLMGCLVSPLRGGGPPSVLDCDGMRRRQRGGVVPFCY